MSKLLFFCCSVVKGASLFSLRIQGSWRNTMFDSWFFFLNYILYICFALCISVVLTPAWHASSVCVREIVGAHHKGRSETSPPAKPGLSQRKAAWTQLIHESRLWRAPGIFIFYFFSGHQNLRHTNDTNLSTSRQRIGGCCRVLFFFSILNLTFIFEWLNQRYHQCSQTAHEFIF